MRRLADLSGRKADAMLARRGRREKARLLRAWRLLHDNRKNRRRRRAEGGEEREEEARENRRGGGRTASSTNTERDGDNSSNGGSDEASGSGSSSDSGTSSSSGSGGSSRSAADGSSDRSSSFASSLSTKEQLEKIADEASSLSSSALRPPSFPLPSAADAAEAGRANFAACFRAETERASALGGRNVAANTAPVQTASEAVRRAMLGGGRKGVMGAPGFTTQEMRALSRFERHRKTHEAEITRVVYGV